jgi:hypothetical protein
MIPGGMRVCAMIAVWTALATVWVKPTLAQIGKPEPSAEESTQEARRHFQNGIKLFRENDFKGALAEFEAAYRFKPGASSLQNIALSLKQLHRYAEAAAALETLLSRHGADLTEPEAKAVNAALSELDGLTATLLVKVTPAGARVTLDGRSLSELEQKQGIRASVGEHTLSAEATGYEPASEVVRLASREKRQAELRLRLIAGFVSVVSTDPNAAIALDGKPLAFQRWSGPVPGGEHYVQVYKPGHQPFEKRLNVELGRTEHVTAPELLRNDEPPVDKTAEANPADQRGWYLLGSLGALGMLNSPQYTDQQGDAKVEGAMIGARGGYRIVAPIAVELMLEGAKNSVKGACKTSGTLTSGDCAGGKGDRLDYDLTSARLGSNLRLMSTGASLRFISTLGIGVVAHRLEFKEERRKGSDPYFMLELGAQMNLGHLLVEAGAGFYLEGASSVGKEEPLTFDPAVLKMIGIGVRGGWSQWRSPKN